MVMRTNKTVKVRKQIITDRYSLYLGDCCEVLPGLPDESVGLAVFSPPFCSLYSYSDDHRDMGNCKSYEEFFEHFGFLVRELHRLLLPGRVAAVHCMDLPTFKSGGEEIGCRDFSADIVRCFVENGFIYHCSRITIWKDPLVAATRTKAIGLAHKQIVKDSTLCRTGMADYIVAFRKPGKNPKPVRNENGLTVYHGARSIPYNLDRFLKHNPLTGEPWLPKENKRSHWIWQKYASPVWDDIRQTKVLPFVEARDQDDQRHICPLQTDVIERVVALWSAKGDVVLTPFMGVGSEVYVAVRNGRKGVGVELKPSYFQQAMLNLRSLERKDAGSLSGLTK